VERRLTSRRGRIGRRKKEERRSGGSSTERDEKRRKWCDELGKGGKAQRKLVKKTNLSEKKLPERSQHSDDFQRRHVRLRRTKEERSQFEKAQRVVATSQHLFVELTSHIHE